MGEIINISDYNLSDYIKERFEKDKEKFPSLKDFNYNQETDTLTYNGLEIRSASYALSRVSSIFFQMNPQDIFDYLKNGFYHQSPGELDKIKTMITTELIITEEEQEQLKKFVSQYFNRLLIIANNRVLFDSGMDNADLKAFSSDVLERSKIIEGVRTGIYHSVAANIILQEYYERLPQLNIGSENTDSKSNELDRGMRLTRQKPGFNSGMDTQLPQEDNQSLGIAGFTSIILIIISAITFGMYLALRLL